MRFFKRNNSDSAAIPEDLQPYYNGPGTGARRWVGPILRGFVLLAVLVLVVWGGIAVVRAITNNSDDKDKTTTAQTSTNSNDKSPTPSNKPDAPAAGSTTPTPKSTPAPTPKVTPTPKATPKATPTPKPTPASTPAPTPVAAAPTPVPATTTPTPAGGSGAGQAGQLVNTGPGDVALLFGTVTVAGAFLYRLYLLRRLS